MNNWPLPTIQMDKCTGCGRCVEQCPADAVDMVNLRPAITRPEQCTYCGTCEEICPEGAIALRYEIVFDGTSEIQA